VLIVTRQVAGPLVAAGRCECEHLRELTDPPTRIDIEAAFLLAVPLVDLEAPRNGSCLLAVDTGEAKGEEAQSRLAGVHVEVREGAVASCVSRLEQEPRTWALGNVDSWIDAILEGQLDRLRVGGESPGLVRGVVAGLHASLLAV
jgi:hypothetical protein